MILPAAQIQDLINDFISRLDYPPQPASLYEPIRYALSAGGKRMRPALMLMAFNLYHDDPQSILFPAVGLETYHNYTLLHDDLMDKSDLRRGRLTVHKKWNSNTAILSGDTMMVLAYKYLATCSPTFLPSVLDCFTQTALEIGEGQQYDMDFEQRSDVTEQEYIEMIRLKTSVLLAAAMKIGGILASASPADQETLYRLGECIGLAFQLQDDYLDVYGDEAVFGKPIGGDILNNKKTFLLIHAEQLATGADQSTLHSWLSATDPDPAAKIAAITALYTRLSIRQLVLQKIDAYFNEAVRFISALSVPENRKTVLRQYVESLRHRQS